MLNEDWFTTGGEDGSLALWFAMKKKPAVLVPAAHGYSAAGVPRWISAIGCLKQSDLVVSGSNDGLIRFWRADVGARSLEQVSQLSCPGCSSHWHRHVVFRRILLRSGLELSMVQAVACELRTCSFPFRWLTRPCLWYQVEETEASSNCERPLPLLCKRF